MKGLASAAVQEFILEPTVENAAAMVWGFGTSRSEVWHTLRRELGFHFSNSLTEGDDQIIRIRARHRLANLGLVFIFDFAKEGIGHHFQVIGVNTVTSDTRNIRHCVPKPRVTSVSL